MEPLCWGAAEGTAGIFSCAMSADGEDIIDQLDLGDLQFLWQGERSKHFLLLYTILLQLSFIDVERSIYMAVASKLHRECVITPFHRF